MVKWKDENFGKCPQDPDYLEDYDAEEDYDRYLDEIDARYQFEKENQ